MKKFAQLFRALDQTTQSRARIKALVDYFSNAENPDKVWAISLFSQQRPKRTINTTQLWRWSTEASDLPLWLFEESYNIVGDQAETIALIYPSPSEASKRNLSEWIQIIIDLRDKEDVVKKEAILNAWKSLDQDERFLFNKLITGGFRIGLPKKLIIIALSRYAGIEESKIAHRLLGQWDPLSVTFEELVLESNANEDLSKPYPLYLPHALDVEPELLGHPKEWIAERKWDGIRGQLILRQNEYYLWAKGEDLVSEKFPELEALKVKINKDVVIDGEILPFKDEKILNFQTLQTRIGRKNITKKQLLEIPVVMVAYDILEYDGEDIRDWPLEERRTKLEEIVIEVSSNYLIYSDNVKFNTWEELAEERAKSRTYRCEGLLLKKKGSTYKVGQKEGGWWKWETDPMTIDAVMIYAQRGSGQKAKVYTGFTFAVKNGDALVPFTKASSGLSDEELEEITQFVKKNTIEKFGPVRGVNPELVFEIAFDGIAKSTRHKSGVSLRCPRIKKWWRDKSKEEINTLKDLLGLLQEYEIN
jgi:DNA ligase-1